MEISRFHRISLRYNIWFLQMILNQIWDYVIVFPDQMKLHYMI